VRDQVVIARPRELVNGRLHFHSDVRQAQFLERWLVPQSAHELDRSRPDRGKRRGTRALLAVLAKSAAPLRM
jgi:hypothetical protein